MNVKEYQTAAADTLVELDKEVNRLIRQGFQPFDGPYYIGKTEGNVDAPICQAMVRTVATPAEIEELAKNMPTAVFVSRRRTGVW